MRGNETRGERGNALEDKSEMVHNDMMMTGDTRGVWEEEMLA
jgi:hypothetical protein